MNKTMIIGNLTKDPEGGKTQNGISYTRFTVAVNRNYKTDDGKNITDYFSVVTWRGLAENCEKYLSKGSKVYVEGEIQTRSYESNGAKSNTFDLIASNVEFLSSPKKDEQKPQKATPEQMTLVDDGDLPF